MDKLRAAIMGKRGKNLDDLQFMTGIKTTILYKNESGISNLFI